MIFSKAPGKLIRIGDLLDFRIFTLSFLHAHSTKYTIYRIWSTCKILLVSCSWVSSRAMVALYSSDLVWSVTAMSSKSDLRLSLVFTLSSSLASISLHRVSASSFAWPSAFNLLIRDCTSFDRFSLSSPKPKHWVFKRSLSWWNKDSYMATRSPFVIFHPEIEIISQPVDVTKVNTKTKAKDLATDFQMPEWPQYIVKWHLSPFFRAVFHAGSDDVLVFATHDNHLISCFSTRTKNRDPVVLKAKMESQNEHNI